MYLGFLLSKCESSFEVQFIADMLNDRLRGQQPKLGEVRVESPAGVVEAVAGVSELGATPTGESKSSNSERQSVSSCESGSTILYNMEKHCEKQQSKEDFYESESETSSISEGEARGRRSGSKSEREKQERKKNVESEENDLEKLLRMTEIRDHRPKSPKLGEDAQDTESGSEANKYTKEEEGKKEDKEKKNGKRKEDEISLIDCLDSDAETKVSSQCSENGLEETKENDLLLEMNSQAKKFFLLSTDESCIEEEEEEEEESEETEKEQVEGGEQEEEEENNEKPKPKSQPPGKKGIDDLREFRVPSLGEETSEEEEGDKTDKSWKDVETSSQDSDSVKCVQWVKKRKRRLSDEQSSTKTESPPSKGRKNIKKILRKEHLQVETQQALKMETERKKRVREREKLFEEIYPESGGDSKLVLEFDPDTMEELVVVDDKLTKQLKPHQRDGVRFMWNCCFESLKRLEEDSGSGCILAHCMGLGKTLQVIALVHTILTHNTGVQTVLIMCPLNAVRNWMQEFKTWLRECKNKIKPFDLIPCKNKHGRIVKVRNWSRNGGVLIVSYDMFRSLIKKDSLYQVFSRGFLDPGPDVVVCDEGHVLKNQNSALSRCMSRIKSLRRIILTGTPLQNNLMEYYCMVQFVKPNILGTLNEFTNRFVHPINNGQFEDSTQLDVRLMKRRAHVLHTMLQGFVQRFSYYELIPFLPEKQEFVISVALTDTQERIYRLFIDQCNHQNRGLFKDFHWLQKVWTHPRVMLAHSEKNNIEESGRELWSRYLRKEDYEDIFSSGKLLLLFHILKGSKEVGDKVLVFSQSLYNLNLIEFFLKKANNEHANYIPSEFADSWVLGEDYFRLDGSTSSENRDMCCQKFNNENNKRSRLFLVSTRAGGMGINLVAANRVVMFDASWNPTHDVQSIFRVYRFGQKKPCFIYRFLAAATMEEKIYRRQVTKLSLAHRILDEHQIERHYTLGNLQELYTYDPIPRQEWKIPKIPKDNLFADILVNLRDVIVGYHEHDSLLENKEEEELTEEERKAAWEDFEKEKLTPETHPTRKEVGEVTTGGPNVFPRYRQNNFAMGGSRNPYPVLHQGENQMCRIVDVRTLQNLENLNPEGGYAINPFSSEYGQLLHAQIP